MQCPRAVIFDLDNTLAESFHAPTPEMSERLERIAGMMPTSIMSAASLERMERDVLSGLKPAAAHALTLFTANASQCYTYDGSWKSEYNFGFTEKEHGVIAEAFRESLAQTGIAEGTKIYGEQIVDYKGYIAFTALGLDAPREEKLRWDPDGSKRAKLRNALMKRLPDLDVYIGGATSVDVTPPGINKAYGVRWLAKHLGMQPNDILFVGDALYPGGNDEVVIETGVQTRAVKNPEETLGFMNELLTACMTH